jgi:O-6-methylguanine DNA methyltransferase
MRLGHVAVRGRGLVVHAWGSDRGLAATRLGEVPDEATRLGGQPSEGLVIAEPDEPLRELAHALAGYLRGRPLEWDGSIDLRGTSAFQSEVYSEVRRIPYGESATYGEIARRIGRPSSVRAVGNALHRNPLPLVVPCHRVLREGGGLGGFAGGTALKRRLLALERGQIELGLEEWER